MSISAFTMRNIIGKKLSVAITPTEVVEEIVNLKKDIMKLIDKTDELEQKVTNLNFKLSTKEDKEWNG